MKNVHAHIHTWMYIIRNRALHRNFGFINTRACNSSRFTSTNVWRQTLPSWFMASGPPVLVHTGPSNTLRLQRHSDARIHDCICSIMCICLTYNVLCIMYVCAYVCMHACMCVCLSMYVYMYICMYICIYVYMCVWSLWSVCMYVSMCVCMICMYVCMHACMHVCLHVRMYVCMYDLYVCVRAWVHVCM